MFNATNFQYFSRITLVHIICIAALLVVCMFGAIDGRLSVINFHLCNSWQACLDVSLELGVSVENIQLCV